MVEDKRTSSLKARRPGFESCSATSWPGDIELDIFLNSKSANVLKGGNNTHTYAYSTHGIFRTYSNCHQYPCILRKHLQHKYYFSHFTDKEIRSKLFSNLSGVLQFIHGRIRVQIKAGQVSHFVSFYYTSLLPGKHQAW